MKLMNWKKQYYKTDKLSQSTLKQRISELREFARTYEALLELVQVALPRTYDVMFTDEVEIIFTEDDDNDE